MTLLKKNASNRAWFGLFLVFLLIAAVGCTLSSSGSGEEPDAAEVEEDEETGHEEDMDHEEDMEEMDHEHDEGMEDTALIPNDGASIRIVAPEDHSSFAAAEAPMVQVEVEGFAVGEEGNHWHIYVDGSSWVMVVGHDTEWVLNGLEPGMHEVMVRLATGSHEELEEGDMVMITIEE
jgi:hypothetical protein